MGQDEAAAHDVRHPESLGAGPTDLEPVTVARLSREGLSGTVDSRVFQDSVEHPCKRAPGYHIILDSGLVITLRGDQVEAVSIRRSITRHPRPS